MSIWSWLKLTAALWLIGKLAKLAGWLIIAAVAVAAWPLTLVAGDRGCCGVAAGVAAGAAVAGRGLVAADDRRLRDRAGAAAARLAGRGAGPRG